MDKKYIDAEHFKLRVMKSAEELNDAAMYNVAKAICEMVDWESGVDVSPSEQKWISVTERLPEADVLVLAVVNGNYRNIEFRNALEIACHNGDGWCLEAFPEWDGPEITYWMPLPEPPGEENHADKT